MLKNKLNNQFTLNFDDEYKQLILKLADIHQRKPAEFLRLLLQPLLIDEYARIQAATHPENKTNTIKL